MCGRYTLKSSAKKVAEFFNLHNIPDILPRYNIAPTQQILTVRLLEGDRSGDLLRWGLIPVWAASPQAGPPLINARSDTVAEKPSFRTAFKKRRCLVPADGFFEWKKEGKKKLPHLFTLADGDPFAIAGIWETWERGGEKIESVCLITTEANEVAQAVHDRMPVILPPEVYAAWLDLSTTSDQAKAFLRPFPASGMKVRQVSDVVNNARHDGPDCIDPPSPEMLA